MFLRSIGLKFLPAKAAYPFNLPLLKNFEALTLENSVTVFTGDNGTGKSTLLEAIAVACEVPTAGEEDTDVDESLAHARSLAEALRLSWSTRTRRGFFLRAEDFFAFQKRVNTMCSELENQAARYAAELDANPDDEGLRRAYGSIRGQMIALRKSYGQNADAFSHGEAFLNYFEKRLAPRGLYILDEPEAPLSPLRQLAFLSMIKGCVEQGSQFIMVTHSPILMAYPNAQIFDFNQTPITTTSWEEVDNVRLWRGFMASPEAFLRRI